MLDRSYKRKDGLQVRLIIHEYPSQTPYAVYVGSLCIAECDWYGDANRIYNAAHKAKVNFA